MCTQHNRLQLWEEIISDKSFNNTRKIWQNQFRLYTENNNINFIFINVVIVFCVNGPLDKCTWKKKSIWRLPRLWPWCWNCELVQDNEQQQWGESIYRKATVTISYGEIKKKAMWFCTAAQGWSIQIAVIYLELQSLSYFLVPSIKF